MNVIILAAGKGTRLLPLTKDKPKCLIKLKNGKTLLEIQIDRIKQINPSNIVIVTGYKSSMIETYIQTKYSKEDNINFEFNPFFEMSNNLASLYLVKTYFKTEDVIVINGDDIFSTSVIEGLANKSDEGVWVTISRKEKYDWDDMKVITEGNMIKQIGKNIPEQESNAESVGIVRFNGKERIKFYEILVDVMHEPEALNWFWLHAIQMYIDRGNKVFFYEIPEISWAEMDFHIDYKMINKFVEQFIKPQVNSDCDER